ncbi:MAG: SBBP repeat-containing protein [Verrucomicrobiota bacterium]|nr:SBBP repeat-containing protein [Verrucomicrobiota bacterium]
MNKQFRFLAISFVLLILVVSSRHSFGHAGLNLAIGATSSPSTVSVGELVTFSISVTNIGTGEGSDIVISNRLANEFEFVSASSSVGPVTRNGQTLVTTMPVIFPGQKMTMTIQARALNSGSFANHSGVSSSEPEVLLANNTFTFQTVIMPAPLPTLISYFGGNGSGYTDESAVDIATDNNGNIYLLGGSSAEDLPVTASLGSPGFGSFVAKFSSSGDLVYSLFINSFAARALDVDDSGHAYILGEAGSFPTLPDNARAGGENDLVVAKINPEGTNVLWALFLGGNDLELGRGIKVAPDGSVYVTGMTTSTNFPTTAGAFQPALAGRFDAFLARIAPSGGSLIFSTYIGGSGSELANGLALDSLGRPVIAGSTSAGDWANSSSPIRQGAGGNRDGFVVRLNDLGTEIERLLFLGGTDREMVAALALDSEDRLYLFGETSSAQFPLSTNALQQDLRGENDFFVMRLSSNWLNLEYSTFIGGPESTILDYSYYVGQYLLDGEPQEPTYIAWIDGALAVGLNGEIHVAGTTSGEGIQFGNFLTPRYGQTDAFYARIDPASGQLLESRVFGASNYDSVRGIALDDEENIYLTGSSGNSFFAPWLPTTTNAWQHEFAGNVSDAFFARFPKNKTPAPDNYNEAPLLVGPRAGYFANNSNATAQPDEFLAQNGSGKTVWFRWVAPANGMLKASVHGLRNSAVSIFSGTFFASSNLLASASFTGDEQEGTQVFTAVTSGLTYFISVDGINGASSDLNLSLTFSEPVNDFFANAQLIASFPVSITTTNENATHELREPAHAGNNGGRSLWWRWVAPSTSKVTVSTAGSAINTLLGIYTGPDPANLLEIKSNDNALAGVNYSELTFEAVAGTEYMIAVDAIFGETGKVQLSLFPGDPPPNDEFANRTILNGYSTNFTSSNVGATHETGEPQLIFTNGVNQIETDFADNTVWFSWTAPTNGRVKISTRGSSFDTSVGIYTGDRLTNLVYLTAHDDILRGQILESEVNFDVDSGQQYQIQIDGRTASPAGVIRFDLRFFRPPRIDTASVQRSNGMFLFTAEGLPDRNYILERSTNLSQWLPVSTNSGASLNLSIPISQQAAGEFFRLLDASVEE